MTCCDTCPWTPTCEEMAEFLDQIGLPPADEDMEAVSRL